LLPALPTWLVVALVVGFLGGILWKGGREERITILIYMGCYAATLALRDAHWPRLQLAGFLIDVVFFLFLLALALRSRSYWPLAACGFQLLGVLTHIAKALDSGVAQWAYISAGIIWSYLVQIAIAVGAWNHWRAGRTPALAVG